MADIFLSYASEDRSVAERLASVLEGRGYSVWWDRTIPAGAHFSDVIETALKESQCVVTLWSPVSTRKHWVLEEAEEALHLGKLVPAVIADDVELPRGFRRIQAADITAWVSGDTEAPIESLIRDIERVFGTSRRRSSSLAAVDRKPLLRVYALPHLLVVQLLSATMLWNAASALLNGALHRDELLWYQVTVAVMFFGSSGVIGFLSYRLKYSFGILQGWIVPPWLFCLGFLAEFFSDPIVPLTHLDSRSISLVAMTIPLVGLWVSGMATGVRAIDLRKQHRTAAT